MGRWSIRGFRIGAAAVLATLLAGGMVGRADDAKKADTGNEAIKEELLKLNRLTSEDAQKSKLLALVKDKAKAKKAVALAAQMQKAAPEKDRPFNFGASMILGRAAHYVKDYKIAEYFIQQCVESATKLESGKKLLQAYDSLIDLYFDTKRYDDVVDTCERFVEIKGPMEVDQAKPFVLERLVQAKAKQGKIDEAMRITEGLIQLDEGGFYFVQLKGWIQREAGKFDEAIETYLAAVDKIGNAKRLKPDQRERLQDRMRYLLSGLYVDNKQLDKAAEQLQTLIKKDPDNPTYKNDLGFIWCDHDMKLAEAEKLIREALDLDRKRQEKAKADGKIEEIKETAAYLDSLAWVLYKQKKYKEALPYMLKAAADEDEGTHLEIWDHLGDVYMALGQKDKAIEAWRKGLTMEDLTKRDAERRKKMTTKLRTGGSTKKED